MRATRLSFHTNHKSKLVSYKPEKNIHVQKLKYPRQEIEQRLSDPRVYETPKRKPRSRVHREKNRETIPG